MKKPITHKVVHKLELEEEEEIFILGISSGVSYHQMAYFLNIEFQWNLSFCDVELPVESKREKKVYGFRYYGFYDELRHRTYFLLKNKQHYCFASNENNKLDYFVFFKGGEPLNENEFVTKLRDINCISAVFPVKEKGFQNLNYLTLENEEN
jgi:hypothetical protein